MGKSLRSRVSLISWVYKGWMGWLDWKEGKDKIGLGRIYIFLFVEELVRKDLLVCLY
jgi:hypothetical protein